MIGILMFCHGSMGEGMRDAAELILGPQERLSVIRIGPGDGRDEAMASLGRALEDLDDGDGVLVLADVRGGTPFNLVSALVLSGEHRREIEMVSGFSLPALLRALVRRGDASSPAALAREVTEHGRRHLAPLAEHAPPRKEA